MASKKLSEDGKRLADQARAIKGYLKGDSRLSTDIFFPPVTLRRFWAGKRIRDEAFDAICKALGIAPADVMDTSLDIQEVVLNTVKRVRNNSQYNQSLLDRCSTIRMPDSPEPIKLKNVFTTVALTNCSNENTNIPNPEALIQNLQTQEYSRVIILGRPGAGKTTLLKYLALQYLSESQVERIPIFVSIARYTEVAEKFSIEEFIIAQCAADGLLESDVRLLMEHGKFLILFDGLNEARQSQTDAIITGLDRIFQSYRKNVFLVSCRKATCEYRLSDSTADNFVVIEIAEFGEREIEEFTSRWFYSRNVQLRSEFLTYIGANPKLRYIASNPLLLTLLCSIFAQGDDVFDGRSVFDGQSDVYGASLEMLLERWNIRKDGLTYEGEIRKRRQLTDLLSQIAIFTFERQVQFFREQDINESLREYLESLTETEIKDLPILDARELLKFYESLGLLTRRPMGHNRFSFSHPIFQEYLTAKYLVSRAAQHSLQRLVEHTFNRRWREIFLLTAEMLPNGEELISRMIIRINSSIAECPKLQKVLEWVDQKTRNLSIREYKLACVRASYLEEVLDQKFSCAFRLADIERLPHCMNTDALLGGILFLALWIGGNLPRLFKDRWMVGLDYGLDQAIDENFANDVAYTYGRGQVLDRLQIFSNYSLRPSKEEVMRYSEDIRSTLTHLVGTVQEEDLRHQLNLLKAEMPAALDNETYSDWHSWSQRLRSILIRYRDIGHDWDLEQSEYEKLKEFYNANLLLVECLKKNEGIALDARTRIMRTLLLPVKHQVAKNDSTS